MAYYMRSNDAHDDSRYLMHAWGDGKGSWGQHKYIDKRWISGAWRYLYELPKKIGQAASNFRNYSTNVDNRASQAGAKKQQNQRASERITSALRQNDKDRAESVRKEQDAEQRRNEAGIAAKNAYEQNQRDKEALDIASTAYANSFARQQRYDANEAKIDKMYADISAGKDVDYNELSRLENEQRELSSAGNRYEDQHSEEWLNTAKNRRTESSIDLRDSKDAAYKATQERDSERAKQQDIDARNADLRAQQKQTDLEWHKNVREEAAANAEKETFKYKASRFLDNILDKADDVTASGASWLKNQMEAGNKWVTNTVNNFGSGMRNTAVQVTSALDNVVKAADRTTVAGAQFLQNMFGSREEAPENVVEPEGLPSRSMPQPSSGGRQYNGTSQKAERQGEGLNNQQAVDRAYDALRQAREDAGWKQHSDGSWSGRSTPETVAAMEEYLRLLEQQGGPVGGISNSSSYGTRPRR